MTNITKQPRQLLNRQISEADLQKNVLTLAKQLHYLCYHTYDSRKSGPDKGFPDLVLASTHEHSPPRVLMIELKTERGTVSTAQWEWLAALMGGSVECYILRPRDWTSGRVEAILTGATSEQKQTA